MLRHGRQVSPHLFFYIFVYQLVVVDRFSKFAHFIPLAHQPPSSQTFFGSYPQATCPRCIVSDQDRIFTSEFWKEIYIKLGTPPLHLENAYHPQTDGQTERVNQCLETYLRCMCNNQPKKWMNWLSLAEYWYNTNFHTSLKCSPFAALYGYSPPQLGLGSLQSMKLKAKRKAGCYSNCER